MYNIFVIMENAKKNLWEILQLNTALIIMDLQKLETIQKGINMVFVFFLMGVNAMNGNIIMETVSQVTYFQKQLVNLMLIVYPNFVVIPVLVLIQKTNLIVLPNGRVLRLVSDTGGIPTLSPVEAELSQEDIVKLAKALRARPMTHEEVKGYLEEGDPVIYARGTGENHIEAEAVVVLAGLQPSIRITQLIYGTHHWDDGHIRAKYYELFRPQ